MSCRGIYSWNLSNLVGAFVDLAIVYLLLCASSVVYIASKFLQFFGLRLPCPCIVLGNYCVQRLLIDCPTEKVENVMISVRTKLPFSEFGVENGGDGKFGGYIRGGGNGGEGSDGRKGRFGGYIMGGSNGGEGSGSSVSDARKGGEGLCSSVSDARKGGEGSCSSMSDVRKGRFGGYIMEGINGGEGSGSSMSDGRKGRSGWYIMEGGNGGEGCSSVSDARKGRFGGYIVEGSNGGEGLGSSVSDGRKGRFGGYIMEGSNGGEGSGSSMSDSRKGRIFRRLEWESARRVDDSGFGEGGFDVKGKGVMNEKRSRGLLRRRRRGIRNGRRHSSVASCDPRGDDVFGGTEMVEDIIGHSDNAIDSHYVDDNQASRVAILEERDAILADEFLDGKDEEEKLSSSMVAMAEPSQFSSSSCGDKHTVKLFEQALINEQAAREALYIELEKERSAAASAADEAMAMILRLQEEKATVEMEARQYQRIIEEKFSYDAEEMNILKDILLIREMEKHSLEKEVEEYRQMLNLGNEQFQEDAVEFENKHLNLLVDRGKDPDFNIDQLTSLSIDEKTSLKDMQTSPCSRNGEQNVQEKEMVPTCGHLSLPPQHEWSQVSTTTSCETSSSREHNVDKRMQVLGEESIQDDQRFLQAKMNFYRTSDAHIPGRENLEKQNVGVFDEVRKSIVVMSDKEQVHDIHVIVDEPGLEGDHERTQSNISMMMSKTISEIDPQPETSSRPSIGVVGDCASSINLHGGTESTSDIRRLPPVGPQQKSISSGQQRNPMSSIDNERFKIDREIGWLQKRLKVIKEGREKLNLSKEPQDRENIQLKLLEDISCQLQAIRLLTESGKAVRQASLPPPSTKVTSKKRRSRSASSGVHKDS